MVAQLYRYFAIRNKIYRKIIIMALKKMFVYPGPCCHYTRRANK